MELSNNGLVTDPTKDTISSIKIGDIYKNTHGEPFEVIDYFDCVNVVIKFNSGWTQRVAANTIRKGAVRDYLKPTIYGVGFNSLDRDFPDDYKYKRKAFNLWKDILTRCYSVAFKNKHPTYVDVICSEDWHDFKNFYIWFKDVYTDFMYNHKWELDKDLRVLKSNLYSKETCSFVPKQVNNIINSWIKHDNEDVCIEQRSRRDGVSYLPYLNNEDSKRISLGTFRNKSDAKNAVVTKKKEVLFKVIDKYKDNLNKDVIYVLTKFAKELNNEKI